MTNSISLAQSITWISRYLSPSPRHQTRFFSFSPKILPFLLSPIYDFTNTHKSGETLQIVLSERLITQRENNKILLENKPNIAISNRSTTPSFRSRGPRFGKNIECTDPRRRTKIRVPTPKMQRGNDTEREPYRWIRTGIQETRKG